MSILTLICILQQQGFFSFTQRFLCSRYLAPFNPPQHQCDCVLQCVASPIAKNNHWNTNCIHRNITYLNLICKLCFYFIGLFFSSSTFKNVSRPSLNLDLYLLWNPVYGKSWHQQSENNSGSATSSRIHLQGCKNLM